MRAYRDHARCEVCNLRVPIPHSATLEGTLRPVLIAGQPLNQVLWLEEETRKHAPWCLTTPLDFFERQDPVRALRYGM